MKKKCDFLGFLNHPMRGMLKPELPWPNFELEPGFNLDLIHVTAVFPGKDATMAPVLARIAQMREAIAREPRLAIVENSNDMDHAEINGQCAVVLGLQDTPDDFDIGILHDAGIRIIAPAYNRANAIGGGFQEPSIGLRIGRDGRGGEFLAQCQMTGMIVDLSHAGYALCNSILRRRETDKGQLKVVATHSGAYGAYAHEPEASRNLKDDVIRRIGDAGGLIGIPTLTFIMDERDNSLAPFSRHLEYMRTIVSDDALCVGSDGYYCHLDPAAQDELFAKMRNQLDPNGKMRSRSPDQPPELNRADRLDFLVKLLGLPDSIAGNNLWRYLHSQL